MYICYSNETQHAAMGRTAQEAFDNLQESIATIFEDCAFYTISDEIHMKITIVPAQVITKK